MNKIFSLKEIIEFREKVKLEGKRVVFTNGVFDILHRGHVEYLCSAKELGDFLIVGINSDKSVKKIKGDKKPIVSQEDRAFILSNLICVDAVCIFDEETPANLISYVIPDILVKGGDYKMEEIVGRDTVEKNGGKVITIPLIEGKSTTNIIATILERFHKENI
jgi:rfaE bifunctional protein nucleotidyltransferase chain/domain